MIALMLMVVFGIPQCATEDSPSCVYVASDAGNGIGHDVWNISEDTWIVLPF